MSWKYSASEAQVSCKNFWRLYIGTQLMLFRFGDGYTVMLKLGQSSPGPNVVAEFVTNRFPGAILKEAHNTMVEFQLPAKDVTVSSIFQAIQEGKASLVIEDYGISQTTLDQV